MRAANQPIPAAWPSAWIAWRSPCSIPTAPSLLDGRPRSVSYSVCSDQEFALMPILIDPSSPDHHLFAREGSAAAAAAKDTNFADCINIGLINNMPDSALIPTERQLFDLLSAAAGKLAIRLHL